MAGIHHPTAPADPEMLTPHPRTSCERERCGLPPWRAADQSLYRQGYAAGYLRAIRILRLYTENVLEVAAPLPDDE